MKPSLTYPEWRQRRERRRYATALLMFIFGPAVAMFAICTVLSLDCATVTDPPTSWPPGSSCAQDPNGPGCAGGLSDDPVTPLAKRDR